MIGPAADAEVEVVAIAIRRNLGVPRHADGGVGEVGEEPDAAVDAGAVEMTGDAVPLGRIGEDEKPRCSAGDSAPPLLLLAYKSYRLL